MKKLLGYSLVFIGGAIVGALTDKKYGWTKKAGNYLTRQPESGNTTTENNDSASSNEAKAS